MTWTINPEFRAFLERDDLYSKVRPAKLPVGDIEGRRRRAALRLGFVTDPARTPEVVTRDYPIPTPDGHKLRARLYLPLDWTPGPLGLFLHGGGWFVGTLDQVDASIADYVARSGVALLAPEYRLAPEHPHPTPLEDAYSTLTWVFEHLDELDADPRRIFVMGDSAGGGMAAGLTLLSRDRGGPSPAAQILIAPMLDDRTVLSDPLLDEHVTWTYNDNITAWQALLGDQAAADEPASVYATPVRADDLSGLPDTFIDTSTLDIFRDEDIAFASRLLQAGVQTELHVYPGVPHRWDRIAPEIEISRQAILARIRAMHAI
ncbi:alpha/beta hydrolase [Pseudoclavibacter sp. CFCC 13796]|uniref:alpha/beta hydrolase n=1 Tax=unclassified Pseudoclavibacter TaxID=2615177 RepID=UPI00130164FD|nr:MULTISPECIES: alpha/beta hydrolase [unclassified Pseudoclavibacter]KAB1645756.1 alpha/beta hydrolase [Pseudoclavibacter sp. CFCC 14310]KAB1661244.1 alpha/beta hydrolase [Pseudoclavibacter sp. CFCC 13796]